MIQHARRLLLSFGLALAMAIGGAVPKVSGRGTRAPRLWSLRRISVEGRCFAFW